MDCSIRFHYSGLIVLPGSAVKIRASSVLLCVAASPLLTARMSMQSYPAAVTITVVVSVVIQVPLSPSLSSSLLPHHHRRRVGCHRHNCRHQRLLPPLVSTSLVACSRIISGRGFLSAGRPGQLALESCDPLTECVRHSCDCLRFVSSAHWSVGCIMTVNSARVYWGVPVQRAKACGDAEHVRDDHERF